MSSTIAKILFGLSAVLLPFFGFVYLFGLAGSNPAPFRLMGASHLAILLSSFFAIKRPKFYAGIGLGALLFLVGYRSDQNFWAEHNRNLCARLKADPYCQESASGFTCREPSKLGNFTVSKSICQ